MHARHAPIDEASVLRAFADIERLHSIASLLLALTDRLLDDERSSELSVMRRVPYSRRQALRHIRFFVTVQWTSLPLALYRELQRRTSPTPATTTSSISARFEQQRLHLHLSQAREYAFAALDSLLAALDRTPHITFWTHLEPRLVHQWAEFLVDEVEAGRAGPLGDRLGRVCRTCVFRAPLLLRLQSGLTRTPPLAVHRLAGALLKIGFCFASPAADALVSRLEHIAAAEQFATSSLGAAHADPLSLFAFLSSDLATATAAAGQQHGAASSSSSTTAGATVDPDTTLLDTGVIWEPESWWPSMMAVEDATMP